MPNLAARCPAYGNHSAAQMTDGDDAEFAVVSPVIRLVDGCPIENHRRIQKIQPALA